MSDRWLIQWMLKIVDLVAAMVHFKTDLCGKQDMFGPENWGKVAASPVFTSLYSSVHTNVASDTETPNMGEKNPLAEHNTEVQNIKMRKN